MKRRLMVPPFVTTLAGGTCTSGRSNRRVRTTRKRFPHAMTVDDALTVLGADALPAGAFDRATAFLEGIGAAPLLARFARASVA